MARDRVVDSHTRNRRGRKGNRALSRRPRSGDEGQVSDKKGARRSIDVKAPRQCEASPPACQRSSSLDYLRRSLRLMKSARGCERFWRLPCYEQSLNSAFSNLK